MRAFHIALSSTALLLAPAALAQSTNPQIDYPGFVELSQQLQGIRAAHLINLADFQRKAEDSRAIILDTRSAEAFRLGHMAGAINLPFSDFTQEKLAQVLGTDMTRAILIYCNNNFSDNRQPIALKRAPLALNIPTFINLHGYGYTNVWELAEIVSTAQVPWEAAPMPISQSQ